MGGGLELALSSTAPYLVPRVLRHMRDGLEDGRSWSQKGLLRLGGPFSSPSMVPGMIL